MFLSARLSALRAPGHGRGRRLLVLALFAAALALAGGASRFDEDQQAIVRIAAILSLAASLWMLDPKLLAERHGLIFAAAAAYLLVLIQLVPLPPQVWAALPGRAPYAAIAAASGTVTWRPLTLTPDLTLNSLYALLPATAAGLAALHIDSRDRIWLARGVVAIAFVSALIGLIQVAGVGSSLHLYRVTSEDAPVGLLANRNHQAAFLSCALALTGALAGLRRRDVSDPRVGLGAALAVAAVLILAVLSTGSRMGLALCALGSLAGVVAYKAAGRRPCRPRCPQGFPGRTMPVPCASRWRARPGSGPPRPQARPPDPRGGRSRHAVADRPARRSGPGRRRGTRPDGYGWPKVRPGRLRW